MTIIKHSLYLRIEYAKDFFYWQSEKKPEYRSDYVLWLNKHIRDFQQAVRKTKLMARNKIDKKTETFTFKGYANINLPDSKIDEALKYSEDIKKVFADVTTLTVDGYSLKVYHNDTDTNYRASITCMNPEDENFGYVLAAFADDWLTAVAVLCFKHYHVAAEVWEKYQANKSRSIG